MKQSTYSVKDAQKRLINLLDKEVKTPNGLLGKVTMIDIRKLMARIDFFDEFENTISTQYIKAHDNYNDDPEFYEGTADKHYIDLTDKNITLIKW